MVKQETKVNPYLSDYREMFTDFRDGLIKWSETGKEPKEADQDVKYYLELQKKRLKSHNISLDIKLIPYGDVSQSSKILSDIKFDPFDVSNYSKSQHHQSIEKTVTYKRNNQKLYSNKDDFTLYQTIIEPASKEEEKIAKMDYVCPNCGAVSKIEILEQGCPYCATRFIISELFPKVNNFWFHRTVNIPEKSDKRLKKCIFFTILVSTIGTFIYFRFIKPMEFGLNFILSTVVGGVLLGGIYGYFIYVGLVFYRLFTVARRDSKVLSGTKFGRNKITKLLSRLDTSFTYEYFQGKILSLLRSIILNDNLDNLIQYAGNKLTTDFNNYLHVNYAGGIGLESAEIKDGKILLSLKIFLLNIINEEDEVKERFEVVRVKMQHDSSFKVDPNFSIQKVSCKGCGQSFNALKERYCPYCDREYHLVEDDWLVTEIEIVKRYNKKV